MHLSESINISLLMLLRVCIFGKDKEKRMIVEELYGKVLGSRMTVREYFAVMGLHDIIEHGYDSCLWS